MRPIAPALGGLLLASLAFTARASAQPQAPLATPASIPTALATGAAGTNAGPNPGEPSVEELIARNKIASGNDRRPDEEHEFWTLIAAGLEGTQEVWRRGADTRSDTVLGPFRTARGTGRGQRWHQNENGQTVLDKPEPSQVERVGTQSVARVHAPLDAWQLTTTYASGHVTRDLFDPKTFLLLRVDRTVAGRDSYTIYDDFRTDARGRTRPWRYYGGDGRPDNYYDYRMQRDEPQVQAAEDFFEVPKDRRALLEFPAGVDTVRLPAQVADSRIYVRVEIAGRGLDFLLDTGASQITMDPSVARELGLGIVGRSTQTVAGSFPSGRVVVPLATVGKLAMRDVVMRTVPFSSTETHGTRAVGTLGFDFLDAAGFRLDYEAGTVDAYRPGTLVAPLAATPLDIALNTGQPVVRATIGDATGDDFVLDTGAAFSYVLFQRFARAHPAALEAEPGDAHPRTLLGVGGAIEYRPISSRRVSLGTWTFDDAAGIETISPNAFGFDNQDGLIGGDILKLFTIYTDYTAAKLFLAPTPRLSAVGARSARADR